MDNAKTLVSPSAPGMNLSTKMKDFFGTCPCLGKGKKAREDVCVMCKVLTLKTVSSPIHVNQN